ncbi:unnamed protein product [Rhodiola kirilowii]
MPNSFFWSSGSTGPLVIVLQFMKISRLFYGKVATELIRFKTAIRSHLDIVIGWKVSLVLKVAISTSE